MEDNQDDAEIIRITLTRANYNFEFHQVDRLDLFVNELNKFSPTLIISDYDLPSTTALEAFQAVKSSNIIVPFIIVSGYLGDETAVEALKKGVTDLVSKNNLERLPYAIDRALNEFENVRQKQKTEDELRLSKERLELAISGSEMGTFDLDITNNTIVYNNRSRVILDIEEMPSEMKFNYFLSNKQKNKAQLHDVKSKLEDHLKGITEIFQYEISFEIEGKKLRSALIVGKVIEVSIDGSPVRMSGTISDITQKKRDADELLRNKMILEEAEEVGLIGSFEWDVRNDLFICSQGLKNILGLSKGPSSYPAYLRKIHPQDRHIFEEVFQRENEVYGIEHRVLTKDGTDRVVRSSGRINYAKDRKIKKVFGLIQDITEQRNLKSSIYRGQEEERKRIAREIHDGIGQMLVAAKYRLIYIGQSNNHISELNDVEELLDLILEEARRIIGNLAAKEVEEHGLKKAILHLVEDLKQASELATNVKIDDLNDLTTELANTIYRITQEALNNIIKYAKATSVRLQVDRSEKYVKLEIQDDGVGMGGNELEGSSGNGLKNMRERTHLFNGFFEVKSSPESGTSIHCLFPLTQDASNDE